MCTCTSEMQWRGSFLSLFKLEESHPLERLALARSAMSAVDMGWDACPTISADFHFLLVARIIILFENFSLKKTLMKYDLYIFFLRKKFLWSQILRTSAHERHVEEKLNPVFVHKFVVLSQGFCRKMHQHPDRAVKYFVLHVLLLHYYIRGEGSSTRCAQAVE